MFRKKRKKNPICTDLLLVATLAPLLNPAAVTLVITAVVARRVYQYRTATDFPQVIPPTSDLVLNNEDMHSTHTPGGIDPLTDLDDEQKYPVSFARKPGFEGMFQSVGVKKSPLAHSAICIRDVDGKNLLVGRQSRCDSTDQDDRGLRKHGINTQPCNEQKYRLFGDTQFQATQNYVEFYGEEIKRAVNKANQNICEVQTCNMLTSNCYSFSIYVLTENMAALQARYDSGIPVDPEDFAKIAADLRRATRDHLGVGVLNNSEVLNAIARARSIADQHLAKSDKEKDDTKPKHGKR